MYKKVVFILITAGFFAVPSFAADAPSSRSGSRPSAMKHALPPFAFEVCAGKKAGDAVQFTTPRGDQRAGVCTDSPEGLFARPVPPPQRKRGTNKQGNT